jgi:hypothetical protein
MENERRMNFTKSKSQDQIPQFNSRNQRTYNVFDFDESSIEDTPSISQQIITIQMSPKFLQNHKSLTATRRNSAHKQKQTSKIGQIKPSKKIKKITLKKKIQKPTISSWQAPNERQTFLQPQPRKSPARGREGLIPKSINFRTKNQISDIFKNYKFSRQYYKKGSNSKDLDILENRSRFKKSQRSLDMGKRGLKSYAELTPKRRKIFEDEGSDCSSNRMIKKERKEYEKYLQGKKGNLSECLPYNVVKGLNRKSLKKKSDFLSSAGHLSNFRDAHSAKLSAYQLKSPPGVQSKYGLSMARSYKEVTLSTTKLSSCLKTFPEESLLIDQQAVNTMFLFYSQKDQVEKVVRYLNNQRLQYSAQVNSIDGEGWGALHYAAMNKNTRFVNLLLYNEVDPNLKGKGGLTPLFLAILA